MQWNKIIDRYYFFHISLISLLTLWIRNDVYVSYQKNTYNRKIIYFLLCLITVLKIKIVNVTYNVSAKIAGPKSEEFTLQKCISFLLLIRLEKLLILFLLILFMLFNKNLSFYNQHIYGYIFTQAASFFSNNDSLKVKTFLLSACNDKLLVLFRNSFSQKPLLSNV